jgi:hypothetical protein
MLDNKYPILEAELYCTLPRPCRNSFEQPTVLQPLPIHQCSNADGGLSNDFGKAQLSCKIEEQLAKKTQCSMVSLKFPYS